jgi:hypothetical protein
MPDVQEVFRMATQKVRPEPGALERQFRGQRKRSRNRKIGGFALAGVIVAAAVVIGATQFSGDDSNRGPLTTNPAPTARTTVAPAFPIDQVASLWADERSGTLLLIRADGRYAIDDSGSLFTPADQGTVIVSGDTLRFTSSNASNECQAGQGWDFAPLRLTEDTGVVMSMDSTTSTATCPAAPAGATRWTNVAYWTPRYGDLNLPGSGEPVTSADETGAFVADGEGILVIQSANGNFRTYQPGSYEAGPYETGTWEVLSGSRLQWTYEHPSEDLGCGPGQTVVTRDEVVEPGVIFQNFVGGTCDLGAGHTVMVRLSPK